MSNHRSRMHVFPFIFSSHLRVRWVLRRCSNIDQSRCSMFFFRLLFSHCAFFKSMYGVHVNEDDATKHVAIWKLPFWKASVILGENFSGNWTSFSLAEVQIVNDVSDLLLSEYRYTYLRLMCKYLWKFVLKS